jgi:hypothetical protein
MSACSAAAVGVAAGLPKQARAGVTADVAAQLKTTLTPMGAERAGNADGSIPAWTGGVTEIPAGWTSGQQQPDLFASDASLLTINKSNMAQYQDMLSVGLIEMLTKYDDFYIKVFPTHRSAAAPQWVYDNVYQNALNATLDPRGARFGFAGAYGGIPFPILDSDPDVAGAQVIWNHITRWDGLTYTTDNPTYVVNDGIKALTANEQLRYHFPYYEPGGSAATFDGWLLKIRLDYLGPPVLVGQVLCEWSSTNALDRPTQAWELLNGQGRVRKAPELTYDTPTATGGGIVNYDEAYGFYGDPSKYNLKLLGKKEMYVPYNNNALIRSDPDATIKAHFLDPEVVRFEKHRVWVVDATLAPGERHTVPHKRFYVDEDNWHITLVDEWDANGDFLKELILYNMTVPSLPATVQAQSTAHNTQTGQQMVGNPGIFSNETTPGISFETFSPQIYNPQFLSASAQY